MTKKIYTIFLYDLSSPSPAFNQLKNAQDWAIDHIVESEDDISFMNNEDDTATSIYVSERFTPIGFINHHQVMDEEV